ncbi:response regulator [Sphingomonas sp. CLY1604]|uniref:response regulator n=1 Tax=Sphingomonas sp. CLY1604 TaxID=3457786 RepID=UPI003FD86E9E
MIASEARISVLLVEDEALVRMLGVDMLEDAGFGVFEAIGADEAMVILAEHEGIDLLFSDVDMPGSMDGLELARLVHQRWPDMRILLTSGHHRLTEAALPDGGRFLRKPWTQAGMIEKVQSTLAH